MESARRPPQAATHPLNNQESGEGPWQQIPTIFKQLSPRQLDVAKLVSKGQTNYQIACDLGITENTVKLYVSQVLRLTHMKTVPSWLWRCRQTPPPIGKLRINSAITVAVRPARDTTGATGK